MDAWLLSLLDFNECLVVTTAPLMVEQGLLLGGVHKVLYTTCLHGEVTLFEHFFRALLILLTPSVTALQIFALLAWLNFPSFHEVLIDAFTVGLHLI